MENLPRVVSVALELTVIISVTTLVWATVMAGLYQLIRDGIRQVTVASQRLARERYVQRTEAGPPVVHPQPTTGH
jgi:hypothetical protein